MSKKRSLEEQSKDTFGMVEDVVDTAKSLSYNPDAATRLKLKKLQSRIDVLKEYKKSLGIDEKCERMENLFTPHLTPLDASKGQGAVEFDYRHPLGATDDDQNRKSMPLVFEKITTAQATLIKESPKFFAEANQGKWRNLNRFVEKVHEENVQINHGKRELRRMVKDFALFGFAYGLRYWKRRWRFIHKETNNPDDTVSYQRFKDVLIDDVVMERIHPRNVLLDDACTGPHDAKDCAIIMWMDEDEFKSAFPEELYADAKYVKTGMYRHMVFDANESLRVKTKEYNPRGRNRIEVISYRHLLNDTEEIMANGVYLDEQPLLGHTIGLNGMKWAEDRDNYDGVGLGQILEIYQPLVDDISNASNERLRQIVRPVRISGNDTKIADDSDQEWIAGANIKLNGDLNQYKWDRPPAPTAGEIQQFKDLMDEVDRNTISDVLSANADADTAYQDALNRESALKKLALPMDAINQFLTDDANSAFPLYREVYKRPDQTELLEPGMPEYIEALAILAMNGQDERVVPMLDGTIARRYFRQKELPLGKELINEGGHLVDTGRVVETGEREFWEFIGEHFNWEGYIRVVAGSYLPVSKALEQQQQRDRATFLLSIPTTDEMGNPTLKDQNGQPYQINRVKALQDYIEGTDAEPEQYIVPIQMPQQAGGNMGQPGGLPVGEKNPLAATEPLQRPQETAGAIGGPQNLATLALPTG